MSTKPIDEAELRQHLADTEPGPSELRDLLVRHHTDPDAVEVLCDHADGSFPLLAAVFAAQGQLEAAANHQTKLQKTADPFTQQVGKRLRTRFKDVTGADLREFLRTARAEFPDEDPDLFRTIAFWFIEFVPLPMLTDEVVAEMSIWEDSSPCPELGAGWPPESNDPFLVGRWLMSRYLYNRFGDHEPSWDMFRGVYDAAQTIGDTADLVAAVEHA